MGFALSLTVFMVFATTATVMARTLGPQTVGFPEYVSQDPTSPPPRDSKGSPSWSRAAGRGRDPFAERRLGEVLGPRKLLSTFDYDSSMSTGLEYNINIPRRVFNQCPNGHIWVAKQKCTPLFIF